jgi:hypothetical protein
MNTTKKTPAEYFSKYIRSFERKNKTRKVPKILYDSEKERDDYEKDYERAPADWRTTMEETKKFLDDNKTASISGVFSRRLDKMRDEAWENYEVKDDFLKACLNKDPSEEEIHKIALENVDIIGSFNMKVDVHAFHEAHRMMIEFPRQGKFTPLQVGAIMCNDTLKALLNLRDKLDIPIEDKPDPNLKDSNGNTTGHLLASSCDAREYTNEIFINHRKMKFFLEKTKSYLDINLQNNNGDTILHSVFKNILERIAQFKRVGLNRSLNIEDYKKILKHIDDYKRLFKNNGLNLKLKNKEGISAKAAYKNIHAKITDLIEEPKRKAEEEKKRAEEAKKKAEEEAKKKAEEEAKRKKKAEEESKKKSKKETKKPNTTRKKSQSPSSPLPEQPMPNCPSKGKKPQSCKTKKDYLKQTLIFHPDRNFDCQEKATEKFKKLQNLCEAQM